MEDFPKNHNLVLIGQPNLMTSIGLTANDDIKSRVTYSVVIPKLTPDDIQAFILSECDKAGLGHNVITPDALALIDRSSEGIIRRARNITISSLLEAIRDQVKTVDIRQVNNVLLQLFVKRVVNLP